MKCFVGCSLTLLSRWTFFAAFVIVAIFALVDIEQHQKMVLKVVIYCYNKVFDS